MANDPTPARIIELTMGFWTSKALLSAVELGVFTTLAEGPLDAEQLQQRLGIHRRSARDFFDALVALGLLDRQDGRYANTAETGAFLDQNKSTYVGGLCEMVSARLYPFWNSLSDALRTGKPQNEPRRADRSFPSCMPTLPA